MSENPHLKKLAANLITGIPKIIVTKEELMNYYIHELNDSTLLWHNLSVNDVVKAAILAGKKVKGRGILEINVSLKEQLEFYSNDSRLYNGKRNRYDATKTLEENKELVISSYLNNVKPKVIAENFKCSETIVRRFLIKKGIIKKRIRKKRV